MMQLLHVVVFSLLPTALLAADCKTTEPEYVVDTETAWTGMPVPGVQLTPLVTNKFNDIGTTNFAYVTMLPNQANPPHRHGGAEEYVFVNKGKLMLIYWIPGMPEKKHVELKPGSFHYIPANGIHTVMTTDQSCEFLVATTPGAFTWEVFDTFPTSFDTKGTMVDVLGHMPCPPGTETKAEL